MNSIYIPFGRLLRVMREIEPQDSDTIFIASDQLRLAVGRWSYRHEDASHRLSEYIK